MSAETFFLFTLLLLSFVVVVCLRVVFMFGWGFLGGVWGGGGVRSFFLSLSVSYSGCFSLLYNTVGNHIQLITDQVFNPYKNSIESIHSLLLLVIAAVFIDQVFFLISVYCMCSLLFIVH